MFDGSILYVFGYISKKIGVAPNKEITSAVLIQVCATVMTSSSIPIFNANNAILIQISMLVLD